MMLKRGSIILLLLLWASRAAAFPTFLEFDSRGLAVAAEAYSDGRVVFVQVVNSEDVPVLCRAVFRSGPEVARGRQALVAPGTQASLSWLPKRAVVRMRVELQCERREPAKPARERLEP